MTGSIPPIRSCDQCLRDHITARAIIAAYLFSIRIVIGVIRLANDVLIVALNI